ncbi:MAG: glycosyltransferase [Candidatus Sedimenticola sp. (ex Thyasira tokunagai)]
MIFVTVGHQMPFDRLLHLVDMWAEKSGCTDIFAQIGTGDYIPKNFQSRPFLSIDEFECYLSESTAIVAHAGTGTIIKTLYHGKPLLVLPRLGALGETRNDHQVGTARHFSETGQILMADDDSDFLGKMDTLMSFIPSRGIGVDGSSNLIKKITQFIEQ